jgi:hypothetical protein
MGEMKRDHTHRRRGIIKYVCEECGNTELKLKEVRY